MIETKLPTVRLGRTDLTVTRTAFGALPLQRTEMKEAVAILQAAVEGGIRFFDTARGYTDSEEKLGNAFAGMREGLVIATKSPGNTAEKFWRDLDTSLHNLKTDYVDILQFHNPSFIPQPGGADGLYDAICSAKSQGMVRHIGITSHSPVLAKEAVASGLYETLQFPFSYLASEIDLALIAQCKAADVGFIAMKALSGGLLTNAKAVFAFMQQHENVVPIYGIQHRWELDEFLAMANNPPLMDAEMEATIAADREELVGEFCRCCGYCLPCPAEIPINNGCRMSQVLNRMPPERWLTPDWRVAMEKVENCTQCGACAERCPYHLVPYEILPKQLAYYREFAKKWDASR